MMDPLRLECRCGSKMLAYPHETATIQRDIPAWLVTHSDCGEILLYHPGMGKMIINRDEVEGSVKAFRQGLLYAQHAGSGATYLMPVFGTESVGINESLKHAVTANLDKSTGNTEYVRHFMPPKRSKSKPISWVIR